MKIYLTPDADVFSINLINVRLYKNLQIIFGTEGIWLLVYKLVTSLCAGNHYMYAELTGMDEDQNR